MASFYARSQVVLCLAIGALIAAEALVTNGTSTMPFPAAAVEAETEGNGLQPGRRLISTIMTISATRGRVTPPFETREDHVELPSGSGGFAGSVEFGITCTSATQATFVMVITAPNVNSDSVYISVDSADPLTWHSGRSSSWAASATSPSMTLIAGSQQLWLRGREGGIKIKSFSFKSGGYEGGCQFQAPHLVSLDARRINTFSGVVTAPFVKRDDYVELPQGAGNSGSSVSFDIFCAAASEVTFVMEKIAPDGNADSVFINVDSGSPLRWNSGISQHWAWSAVSPSLTVIAGSQKLWLTGREDGIAIKTLQFASGHESGACQFQCPPAALISISAVSGSASAPFEKKEDYVEFPQGSWTAQSWSGSVDFGISCTAASEVTFVMEKIAPNGNADSVYISIDSGSLLRWDSGLSASWAWSQLSPSVAVPAGSHRLLLSGREDGIKIKTLMFASGFQPGGCQFQSTARQALKDTVLQDICNAQSRCRCDGQNVEATRLHGLGCAWMTDHCEISGQEAGCMADTLAQCQAKDEVSSDTCVWSGSMCFAFKQLSSNPIHPHPAWSCQWKDPATCEPNVALQLAANGHVDSATSAAFDWSAQQAALVQQFVFDEIRSNTIANIPVVGPTLNRLVGLAFSWHNTDTAPTLCSTPGESTGECLFRHIAEYLDIYVEEVLVQDKYKTLQQALNGAAIQFDRLQNIIAPLGSSLQNLTRADVPIDTRDQIDEHLANNQHSMSVLLQNEFMSVGTFFAPRQATYATMYATALFQIWASQILFNPTYFTAGQVANLVDEIDRVTQWVLQQMATAKQNRLDEAATEGQLESESNPGPTGSGVSWLALKDDFDKCPWTDTVEVSRYQCGRGCVTSTNEDSYENARLCLKLRTQWVSWSQDVFWREALQVHLTAWEDLKHAALAWPTKEARLLSSDSSTSSPGMTTMV